MIFEVHKPMPPLDDCVDTFTFYAGYSPEHSVERLLPDGHTYLLFNLDDEPKYVFDNESLVPVQSFSDVWFSGIMRGYISITAGNNSSMLVVRFKPGGAHAILGIPMHELTDSILDADLVLGPGVVDAYEQMRECDNAAGCFAVIESWLLSRMSVSVPNPDLVFALSSLIDNPAIDTIATIANQTGMTGKQLIRRFNMLVGLPPKYFQRILRFNRVLETIETQGYDTWTSLAYDCGFYDQAHFIREFKHFSGYTPSIFASERGDRVNYLPVG